MSTKSASVRVSDNILLACDSGNHVVLVLLDLTAVFFKISITLLSGHLNALGLSLFSTFSILNHLLLLWHPKGLNFRATALSVIPALNFLHFNENKIEVVVFRASGPCQSSSVDLGPQTNRSIF